ncbi:hypothetical protein EOL94_03010, partial [bacterium]|nr:hypothetical protein [bacterium]
MENENSFIKSNNSQKVKIGQISDLEKEKSGKILNENVENLKVHKMPNSFKLGQFDSTIHPNDMGVENKGKADKIKKESSNKHKKTGMLIIIFGVIILLVLGYFLYRYLFNNNETIFLTKNNNEITEVENNNNVNEEENNEEDIQDPLVEEENNEEDIQDPLVEEEN